MFCPECGYPTFSGMPCINVSCVTRMPKVETSENLEWDAFLMEQIDATIHLFDILKETPLSSIREEQWESIRGAIPFIQDLHHVLKSSLRVKVAMGDDAVKIDEVIRNNPDAAEVVDRITAEMKQRFS